MKPEYRFPAIQQLISQRLAWKEHACSVFSAHNGTGCFPAEAQTPKPPPLVPLLLACLLFTGLAPQGQAATITWTNTSGGLWSQPANWSPNQAPGASDAVFITQPGTYRVTLNVNATVASLTLGGASGQQRLTNYANNLTIGSHGTSDANSIVDWAGGTLSSSGFYRVNTNAILNWSGGIMAAVLTVASNGVVNLSGTGNKSLYRPMTNWGTVHWTGGTFGIYNNFP